MDTQRDPGSYDLYSPEVEALDDSMTCTQDGHVDGCQGAAGGEHELVRRMSYGDRVRSALADRERRLADEPA